MMKSASSMALKQFPFYYHLQYLQSWSEIIAKTKRFVVLGVWTPSTLLIMCFVSPRKPETWIENPLSRQRSSVAITEKGSLSTCIWSSLPGLIRASFLRPGDEKEYDCKPGPQCPHDSLFAAKFYSPANPWTHKLPEITTRTKTVLCKTTTTLTKTGSVQYHATSQRKRFVQSCRMIYLHTNLDD